MERAYWLSRQQASFMLARAATSADARLIHYDLAGRYSVKAAWSTCERTIEVVASVVRLDEPAVRPGPFDLADETYHRQLSEGARYSASEATSALQFAEHKRTAAKYMRLAREAVGHTRTVS